ncbi:hypothetical protein ACIRNI_24190 [Streptomyces sp. NPDC093546]|uniref:hypothetical protein n=1 Tax=Streptomyces sp. NPDC093546 TaxID=3366040 RepID=UPI00381AB1F9
MNAWMPYAAIAVGVVLLALYLTDILTTVPYSIFAVLAGTALIVDGCRGLFRSGRLRNSPGRQEPGSR